MIVHGRLHGRRGSSRIDARDPDPRPGDLLAIPVGQGPEAELGGGVLAPAGIHPRAGDRVDEDDLTLGRHQRGRERRGEDEGGAEVHRVLSIQMLDRGVLDRAERDDARGVDQGVEPREFGGESRRFRLEGAVVGEVEPMEDCPATPVLDLS